MERTISDETENALCKVLSAPAHCPHGRPISPCNKNIGSCDEYDGAGSSDTPVHIREKNIISITDLLPEQKGKIAFIRGDCKVVQHLSDLGLTLGTTVSVMRKAPAGGPVEIPVRRTKLAVDHTIAENIFIESPVGSEA